MAQVIDLDRHSIGRTLFNYALPSTVSVWIFALYTMVDGMFVGKGVGPRALAAVNLSLPFISMMFAISILVTIGAATIAASKRGEGKFDDANRIFSTAVYSLFGFGMIACTLGYIYIEEIAQLLGAEGEMIGLVTEYLSTLLIFNTFYLVAYSMEVFCKIDGFPRRELLAIITAALTNIVLDYILVIELQMGLRGAAIATGVAQTVVAVMMLAHFFGAFKEKGTLKFTKVIPSPTAVLRYIKIGIPDSITELSAGVVLLIFNNAILTYLGEDNLTAFSVIGYINNLMLLTMVGLTQGMQPIVSFLNGRGSYHPIAKTLTLTVRTAFLIGSGFYLAVFFFGDWMASLFLADPKLVLLSHGLMKVFSTAFIFMGMNIIFSGFYTSLEKPIHAGAIALLRGGVLTLALVMILPPLLGTQSIWYVALATEMLVFVFSMVLVKKSLFKWRKAIPATAVAAAPSVV